MDNEWEGEYNIVPAPPKLWSDILDKGWFDQEVENRKQGFGEGMDGRLFGINSIADLAKQSQESDDLEIFSVQNSDDENIALVAAEHLGERYKTVDLMVFVDPGQRRKGIFRHTVNQFLDILFTSGIYRVQGEVLRINREAITAARSLGFTWESTRRQGIWMDGHPQDIAVLRILRADWKKLRKGAQKEV